MFLISSLSLTWWFFQLRDLLKWCQRIQRVVTPGSMTKAHALPDAFDLFAAGVPMETGRLEVHKRVANLIGVDHNLVSGGGCSVVKEFNLEYLVIIAVYNYVIMYHLHCLLHAAITLLYIILLQLIITNELMLIMLPWTRNPTTS